MKRWAMALLLAALLAAASGCARADGLRVDFYDVGKADAMLITTPQGWRILIDAATNKEGKKLAQRLAGEGIGRLDAMIITHYDKDHVGGADQMLETFDVGTVVMPVYDKESKQHTQFLEALEAYPPGHVEAMAQRSAWTMETPDGVTLRITSAHEADYGEDEENDFSLCVRMDYGSTRFLFAGDAENARQRELLAEGDVACDVLKAPYHGRWEASSQDFLTAAHPQLAFIPDSDEEPASALVLSILAQLGTRTYCARDGGVSIYSDGTRVWAEALE